MDITVISTIAAFIVSVLSIIGWFNRKSKDTKEEIEKLIDARLENVNTKFEAIEHEIEENSEEFKRVRAIQAHHSHKISQGDIIMVHIDETLKQLSGAVKSLDETLNAMKIGLAKIENKEE